MRSVRLFLAVATAVAVAAHAADPGYTSGPVPRNASRITGVVLDTSGAPGGYGLTVRVVTAAPASRGEESLAVGGMVIQGVSASPLPAALEQKRIEATVRFTRDAEGERWLVSGVRVLTKAAEPAR
jgi:hypothetical protein